MQTRNKTIFSDLTSISDIVEVMIKGIEKEWVKIDMNTFYGNRKLKIFGINYKTICVGCAATNTLCELSRKKLKVNLNELDSEKYLHKFIDKNEIVSFENLKNFEYAIDALRLGNIRKFSKYLNEIKHLFNFDMPQYLEIEYYAGILPKLHNDNYKTDLVKYKDYVKFLKSKNL